MKHTLALGKISNFYYDKSLCEGAKSCLDFDKQIQSRSKWENIVKHLDSTFTSLSCDFPMCYHTDSKAVVSLLCGHDEAIRLTSIIFITDPITITLVHFYPTVFTLLWCLSNKSRFMLIRKATASETIQILYKPLGNTRFVFDKL